MATLPRACLPRSAVRWGEEADLADRVGTRPIRPIGTSASPTGARPATWPRLPTARTRRHGWTCWMDSCYETTRWRAAGRVACSRAAERRSRRTRPSACPSRWCPAPGRGPSSGATSAAARAARPTRLQARIGGKWRWLGGVRRTNASGFFRVTVRLPKGAQVRAWSARTNAYGATLALRWRAKPSAAQCSARGRPSGRPRAGRPRTATLTELSDGSQGDPNGRCDSGRRSGSGARPESRPRLGVTLRAV